MIKFWRPIIIDNMNYIQIYAKSCSNSLLRMYDSEKEIDYTAQHYNMKI